jgi:hypothetical protein
LAASEGSAGVSAGGGVLKGGRVAAVEVAKGTDHSRKDSEEVTGKAKSPRQRGKAGVSMATQSNLLSTVKCFTEHMALSSILHFIK